MSGERVELLKTRAKKFLELGFELFTVSSSTEKLYKLYEEEIKALTIYYKQDYVLMRVVERLDYYKT